MNAASWSLVVVLAALASAVVANYLPEQQAGRIEVHQCGENAGWIEAPAGHVTCTLKNGKVINLRSAK